MSDLSQYLERAHKRDLEDPLKGFRGAFSGLDETLIYLDGNSLGPQPAATAQLLKESIEEDWGKHLIRSWNSKWYMLPEHMGDLLAPILGANAGEVCFTDSVTVNLFKLAAPVLANQTGRKTILTDDLNFPSDLYTLEGLINLMGSDHQIKRVHSTDGITIPTADFSAQIDSDTALVTLSHVVFKSGFMHDLAAICEAAHKAGALVLADLSHSVGAVPIDLEKWGVDLAIGCSYKYLNGGPGAPAFLYVRKSLQASLDPLMKGWFGSKEPFSFNLNYTPATGIRRFMVGTPPILSLQAAEVGIKLLNEAGMDQLRAKSIQQTELMIELGDALLKPLGFRLGSPRDPSIRGSHIAFQHPEAFRINRAMISPPEGKPTVIPDFRTPDNLRLGVAPLFLSHVDIVRAVERICEIVQTREYQSFSDENQVVT